MIWETGTRTIAMLTQCYEKGRVSVPECGARDWTSRAVFAGSVQFCHQPRPPQRSEARVCV